MLYFLSYYPLKQLIATNPMHSGNGHPGLDPASFAQLTNQMGQLHIATQSVETIDTPLN